MDNIVQQVTSDLSPTAKPFIGSHNNNNKVVKQQEDGSGWNPISYSIPQQGVEVVTHESLFHYKDMSEGLGTTKSLVYHHHQEGKMRRQQSMCHSKFSMNNRIMTHRPPLHPSYYYTSSRPLY